MKTLRIQQLNREVSRIGLGSVTFSTENREAVFAVLDAYRGLGGNLIDTAASYSKGESESVIGEWFTERDTRSEMVILDKGAHDAAELTPDGIRSTITASLERLQTDYLDVWATHRDHAGVPVGSVVDTLNEEMERGRIRAFGFSNWSVPRVAAALEYAEKQGLRGPALSSPHLSLAVPMEPLWQGCVHATEEDLSWHAETGLPLFVWSPLAHGFFSDNRGPFEDSGEWVKHSYHNEENFERRARAEQLANEKGASLPQIALAYVLSLPAPIAAFVGALSEAEIQSAVAASEISLSQAELDWVSLKASSR